MSRRTIGPTTAPDILDGGNNTPPMDPLFNDATIDLSLKAISPVKGKANTAAVLTGIAARDVAGTSRVAALGAGADIGAYVVPAQ